MKLLIGIAAGFGIDLACWLLGIPSPAPLAVAGALLLLAIKLGYPAGGLNDG